MTTPLDFPNNPHPGDTFKSWYWDGEKWIQNPHTGYAPIYSPEFEGQPTTPTPPPFDNSKLIPNTHWVQELLQVAAVASFNGRRGDVELTVGDIVGAGGAPLASPAFTGVPTAPQPPLSSSDGTVATTAWVRGLVEQIHAQAGVLTVNGKSGFVTITLDDITAAGGAPLFSPAFKGTPTAPTPPDGDWSNRLATTAWVQNRIKVITNHVVTSVNGRSGDVELDLCDILNAGGAPITSPEFEGVATVPTPKFDSNDFTIANTAWVQDHLRHLTDEFDDKLYSLERGVVLTFNGRRGHIKLSLNDITGAGGAPLNSPAFTGRPTAPTPPAGDASNRIATTCFVEQTLQQNLPERGPPGLQGPQGCPGRGIQVLPSVPTVNDLPTSGNQAGDIRVAEDTGIAYTWELTPQPHWSAIGSWGMRGEPGPQGPQGPVGQGLRSRGTVPTASALPPSGNSVGDFYVALDTNTLWVWNGTTWVNSGPAASETLFGPSNPGVVPQTNPITPVLLPFYNIAADGIWRAYPGDQVGSLNANYTIPPTQRFVSTVANLSGPITFTLPLTTTIPLGHIVTFVIIGPGGGATTFPVTVVSGEGTASIRTGRSGLVSGVAVDNAVMRMFQFMWTGGSWNYGSIYPPRITFNQLYFNDPTATPTYTPTRGLLYAMCEVKGGGGASMGFYAGTGRYQAAAGGGEGGYFRRFLTPTQVGVSLPVLVGAGGVASATTFGNGGASSVGGALVTANGGQGATGWINMVTGNTTGGGPTQNIYLTQSISGVGGTTTLNNNGLAIYGISGTQGRIGTIGGTTYAEGGTANAGTPLRVFDQGSNPRTQPGSAGSNGTGQGGRGGCTANDTAQEGVEIAGGNGGNGYVRITEFLADV